MNFVLRFLVLAVPIAFISMFYVLLSTEDTYPGADYKVLKGLSFDKFRPEIICVEIHEKEIKASETFKLLDANKYDLIWSGVFSHIFRYKN